MLEVAGELHQMLAKFENPAYNVNILIKMYFNVQCNSVHDSKLCTVA